MTNLAQDTTKSAKALAQNIARQMAQEPLEILKDIRKQATGEKLGSVENKKPVLDQKQTSTDNQNELQDKMKSGRRMEALQREIEDIHKQNIFSQLQKRISGGEEIPLEEYTMLSMEQKQVLKAQMEAVRNQARFNQENLVEVPVVRSKPSRRFGAGQKHEAEKQQTRVEKPVPPSG